MLLRSREKVSRNTVINRRLLRLFMYQSTRGQLVHLGTMCQPHKHMLLRGESGTKPVIAMHGRLSLGLQQYHIAESPKKKSPRRLRCQGCCRHPSKEPRHGFHLKILVKIGRKEVPQQCHKGITMPKGVPAISPTNHQPRPSLGTLYNRIIVVCHSLS